MKYPARSLKIEKPCHKDWDTMPDAVSGKFCQHCRHHVIDFSNLADNEILQLIEQSGGKICGRFDNSQLNRPLVTTSVSDRNRALNKVLAGLLLLSSASAIYGQNSAPETAMLFSPIVQTEYATLDQAEIPKDSVKSNILHGQVFDKKTKKPVPSAKVGFLNIDTTIITDKKGDFTLVMPDSISREVVTLWISHNRYDYLQYNILESELPNIQLFFLKQRKNHKKIRYSMGCPRF